MTQTIHAVDPAVITKERDRKIASLEKCKLTQLEVNAAMIATYEGLSDDHRRKNWLRAPLSQVETAAIYDIKMARERDYYALVEVLEDRDASPKKPFFLVYAGDHERRTGGFASYDAALGWYIGGRR